MGGIRVYQSHSSKYLSDEVTCEGGPGGWRGREDLRPAGLRQAEALAQLPSARQLHEGAVPVTLRRDPEPAAQGHPEGRAAAQGHASRDRGEPRHDEAGPQPARERG